MQMLPGFRKEKIELSREEKEILAEELEREIAEQKTPSDRRR